MTLSTRTPGGTGSRTRYVAVAGNIGAGKSSLVKWLCHNFQLAPFFEPHAENPYLEDFYRDMRRWAFPSQLYFLVQRFRIHRQLEAKLSIGEASHDDEGDEAATRGIVQDRTIYEDAEVFGAHHHEVGNIDERDYRTYRDLYETLRAELAPPDLMIYLRCPLRTLRKRIKLRGRDYEAGIPLPYLRALDRLYETWFAGYRLSPTLVVDTSEIDYVTRLFDRRALVDEIEGRLR